ncbi:MAG TPA: hypothetical protein VN860_06220, partial [Candidatus Acidoferrales bacterium]|nr:hypothetical protein [Candidatus Acidoferrales bacterium]
MRLWYFDVSLLQSVAFTTSLILALSLHPHPSSKLTIYPRAGSPRASAIAAKGPGLILMGGGGDVDSAFVWMCHTIAGDRKKHCGDVVVLRASGDNDYDRYLLKLAPFNSAQTIKIERGANDSDLTIAANIVDHAQGVFFGGGDQANYVRWKGTPLAAAVQRVYDRGGVIGGNSAGLAIQGEWVYDSDAADVVDRELTTNDV